MSYFAYILRCRDGCYYAGHTDDLERRIAQLQAGEIEGFTQRRRPVELMWSEQFATRAEALAAELRIKGWSRAKKEALFEGDWTRLSLLARKSFDTPVRRRSPATQDERLEGRQNSPPFPFDVNKGPCEAEDPASKAQAAEIPPPAIVLVRPQLGRNIGKAARAMLNFGLTDLRLVAPRDGWPNPDAGPAASGADAVLGGARLFDTLAEAVADCAHVYASTVRRRGLAMPVISPEQMGGAISASPARSAILFGPERAGLETDEVAIADAIVTVPINPAFGSLNLAQAVILLAYEWSRGQALAQPPARDAEPPAPRGELDALIDQLDEALAAAGYFHPPERSQATRNTLRTIFTRPGWSSREVRAVRGVIRALAKPRRD